MNAAFFASSTPPKARAYLKAWLRQINQEQAQALLDDWHFWARPAQIPPGGDWRCWLFMGGRGAGKTRAGAEWITELVRDGRARRIALIGPTLGDVREVMIEGPSGLRTIARSGERPEYTASRRRLVWPNKAQGYVFSAEEPDRLRGPQFDAAWCDEIAAWNRGPATWDMLMLALRLGTEPRVVATTTPRPVPLVTRLAAQNKNDRVVMTSAGMHDNASFLAPGFVDAVEAAYGGCRLGRQEINGELLCDPPDALWTRAMIDNNRREAPEPMVRVVVAIDPPASSGPKADACGIIAAGTGADGACYVLADATTQGQKPLDWAARTGALAREIDAGHIIAEANQGGEMVREMLIMAGCDTPIRLVHARRAKTVRAEPVAALYHRGRVHHAGLFPALEDQMCVFGAPHTRRASPDRVDALVWAIWALAINRQQPQIRNI